MTTGTGWIVAFSGESILAGFPKDFLYRIPNQVHECIIESGDPIIRIPNDDSSVLVPYGPRHSVLNRSKNMDLKLVYSIDRVGYFLCNLETRKTIVVTLPRMRHTMALFFLKVMATPPTTPQSITAHTRSKVRRITPEIAKGARIRALAVRLVCMSIATGRLPVRS
jgi:hypothetical protein